MIKAVLCLLAASWMTNAAPATESDEYRVSPGDVIAIQVFGEPDLSPQIKVGERGTIPYPFLGELQISGLTTADIEKLIHDGLEGPYLVDPKVTVAVAEYRPFYIDGQVKRPGSYPWEPGLTVQKALTMAGGLTERASARKIFLVPDGAGSDAERARVDFDEPVGPGDIITVEESFF